MWQTVCGAKPMSEFDTTSSKCFIYQRKNIRPFGNLWMYDEQILTKDEYEKELRIKTLEAENTQLQLAITELYESMLEG